MTENGAELTPAELFMYLSPEGERRPEDRTMQIAKMRMLRGPVSENDPEAGDLWP